MCLLLVLGIDFDFNDSQALLAFVLAFLVFLVLALDTFSPFELNVMVSGIKNSGMKYSTECFLELITLRNRILICSLK